MPDNPAQPPNDILASDGEPGSPAGARELHPLSEAVSEVQMRNDKSRRAMPIAVQQLKDIASAGERMAQPDAIAKMSAALTPWAESFNTDVVSALLRGYEMPAFIDSIYKPFENAGYMDALKAATSSYQSDVLSEFAKSMPLVQESIVSKFAISDSLSHQLAANPPAWFTNTVSPVSQLFAQLDTSPAIAATVLGAGSLTESFASSIARMTAVTEHMKLPAIVDMAQLASLRSLLDYETPTGPMVDRIGRGWASLGDRVIGGRFDVAELMPASNRLATRAYRFDILVGEESPTDTDLEALTGLRPSPTRREFSRAVVRGLRSGRIPRTGRAGAGI